MRRWESTRRSSEQPTAADCARAQAGDAPAREPSRPLAAGIAPGNRSYGAMLAYTPVHHLLFEGGFDALVATSGNVSDEPIAFRDEDALERLAGIADAFLVGEREIYTRVDDSIVRCVDLGGSETVGQAARTAGARAARSEVAPIRRARGYTPEPVSAPFELPPLLAVGPELKNTVCLSRGRELFLSHHIGDLKNEATMRSFEHAIEHLSMLLEVAPGAIAHDMHPGYLSTRYALAQRAAADGGGAAPPRAHGGVHVRARAERAGGGGDLRRHGVRDGRQHLGRRVPGGRLRGLRARGAPRVLPAARWGSRGGRAVPGGALAAVGGLRGGLPGARPAGGERACAAGAGGAHADAPDGAALAADIEHGAAVRRGGGADRGARALPLRSAGGDRARAARHPGGGGQAVRVGAVRPGAVAVADRPRADGARARGAAAPPGYDGGAAELGASTAR